MCLQIINIIIKAPIPLFHQAIYNLVIEFLWLLIEEFYHSILFSEAQDMEFYKVINMDFRVKALKSSTSFVANVKNMRPSTIVSRIEARESFSGRLCLAC